MSMTDEEAQCAIIQGAREYLADEQHWLRDGRFTDSSVLDGMGTADFAYVPITAAFPAGVRCCAIGAMYRAGCVNDKIERWRVHGLVRRLGVALVGCIPEKDRQSHQVVLPTNVPTWNDHTATHESLLETFDKAREQVCT